MVNILGCFSPSKIINVILCMVLPKYCPPQSVLDGRRLTINDFGWAHRSPVCVFLAFWLQIAIEPFALYHRSVLIIYFYWDVSQME